MFANLREGVQETSEDIVACSSDDCVKFIKALSQFSARKKV